MAGLSAPGEAAADAVCRRPVTLTPSGSGKALGEFNRLADDHRSDQWGTGTP